MPLIMPPPGEQVSHGAKRRLLVICAVVVAVLGVAGAWAAARPGSYGASGGGCVTVTIPSTTGGGLLHECGPRARTLCRHAFRHGDRVSLLIRPECRRAGLG